MNINDIGELGLSKRTKDEMEIDPTKLIITDEFHRRDSIGAPKVPYAERAIDRLIRTRIPWYTEWNITHTAVKRYVRVQCPYCQTDMVIRGDGGSGLQHHWDLRCDSCHATGSLRMPAESALSFSPSPNASR